MPVPLKGRVLRALMISVTGIGESQLIRDEKELMELQRVDTRRILT
jgi:hypothetical protein